jgi:hypothetical protein|tara:strand:+ start:498 stop:851 length:354 start_codon:yes stop_codon:yes gene_type:complete
MANTWRGAHQLSLEQALIAKKKGMDRVEDGAHESWKMQAMEAIWRCAKKHHLFFVDDVWGFLDEKTYDNRAMGPMMRKASSLKWIAPTREFKPSASPKSHGNPRRVWESLIIERNLL